MDIIGTELLDIIENNAAVRARWVPRLRATYWSYEPPEIRRHLLGLPSEPG